MAHLLKCSVFVLLLFYLALVCVRGEWILAPRPLYENTDYTGYDFLAKIRSDKENFTKIIYAIQGPGVDQDPTGIFSIDKDTGFVKVHAILDREERARYLLKGVAFFANRSRAERDLDLKFEVLDMNDNTPIIQTQQVGNVSEGCKAGTVVMKVIATDADDPNTENAKIFYRIDERSNRAGMFYIDASTGEIKVSSNNLDRETQDVYKLVIFASDLNGRAGGNMGTGEITIKVTDINDNVPYLEKNSYEASVEENTVGVEVLRLKAYDLDEVNTDNWAAVYEIASGNEAGYFTITTDAKTNEGVIMINKAVDYEELKTLNLDVRVSNKAKYNMGSSGMTGASMPSKSYPIKINVVNQKEGPRFQPTVKVVAVSEDKSSISLNKVIATYTAIDSDTQQTATNVRYLKLKDQDNWLSIDEKTAEIKLNKLPDRESIYLKNGTYYAEILCISNEIPSKTATGTIAIQVEDFNDHCPQLTSTVKTMCLEDRVIYATAVDQDEFPNSAPFDFNVIQDDSKQNWAVEVLNETTVILRDKGKLWPGNYKVKLEIKDQQGKSCDDLQIVDLVVCSCDKDTKSCVARRKGSAVFGAAGILLLLLGLLLLLLIPLLLLLCLCGNVASDFKAIPYEAREHLISYQTEGQGEDRAVPMLPIPVIVENGNMSTKDILVSGRNGYLSNVVETDRGVGGAMGGGATMTAEEMHMYNQYRYGQEKVGMMGSVLMGAGKGMEISKYKFDGLNEMALPDHYLGEYLSNKLGSMEQYKEKENSLAYNYEGQESPAGSVGCCSLLENNYDLAFLDDLGPKFKTLAEICNGGTFTSNSVTVEVSKPPVKTIPPVMPSASTHTHVHTHTETVRERDRVNTLSASKVASESSTIVQEQRVTDRSQGFTTLPKVQVQENVIIPNQTLLIQQPTMYYAATPMYVVESNPQMVLVSGAQQAVGQVSQAGLSQGIVQVGGLQGSQGVVLVEGQVGMGGATSQIAMSGTTARQVVLGGATSQVPMSGTTRQVVLGGATSQVPMGGTATRQVAVGGVKGQKVQGVSQGVVSESSQVLLVENGSAGGSQSTNLVQGFGQTGLGSLEAGFDKRGKGVQLQSFSTSSRGSAGSKEDFPLMTTPKAQGSPRVVVQHKKVTVTETNTRA
ncbi:desmoglein-2-like protein [Nothobranchius furzeri]|uniref:Desmoglein-2-like n=1 Tax=Nothobranchius furzeri TaxID=105023 RepID=A0A8C6L4X1_NOTFU|nr:desmoglein-2-like [Nothobranchius furzeri]